MHGFNSQQTLSMVIQVWRVYRERQYSIIWICTSLIINNYCTCRSSIDLLSNFKLRVFFFCYILDRSSLSDTRFANISPLAVAYIFLFSYLCNLKSNPFDFDEAQWNLQEQTRFWGELTRYFQFVARGVESRKEAVSCLEVCRKESSLETTQLQRHTTLHGWGKILWKGTKSPKYRVKNRGGVKGLLTFSKLDFIIAEA